jgi:hypothetical protein
MSDEMTTQANRTRLYYMEIRKNQKLIEGRETQKN